MEEAPLGPAGYPSAEFEVRNEWQKQNVSDISKFFLFLFDSNDVSATNVFKKITVAGDGTMGVTTQEFGGGASSRRRPTGVCGRSPQRCSDFSVYFQK